ASWTREELWKQRNFHQAFEHGQISGLFNAGIGIVTGGRGYGVVNRLEGRSGHERMERIQRYFATEDPHPPEKMKFDGAYTFDKVSDVYYGGVVHEENQPAHLLILDTEVCITRCTAEYGNPCFHFCPANVYEPKPTAVRTTRSSNRQPVGVRSANLGAPPSRRLARRRPAAEGRRRGRRRSYFAQLSAVA